MKRIAVFGKPGSGKSTLSKKLSSATGIPLYQLDYIAYKKNGELEDREVFDKSHNNILSKEYWLVDGIGPIDSFHARLEIADTLIYLDLPYFTSYWLVTKRLLKSIVNKPDGWPDGCSVFKGTLESYRILRLCPKLWNDKFMRKLEKLSVGRSLYVIRSISELNSFVRFHAKSSA